MNTTVKILVVEDEMIIGAKISMLLTQLGYEVTAIIPRGEEAVMHVEENQPDIVLLDYHLPHSSGLQALQAFADQFPWIARVVISGDERQELAVQARAYGASGLISKALPIEQVLLAIQTVAAGAEWWAQPAPGDLAYAESAWSDLPIELDEPQPLTDASGQTEPAFTLRQLQVLRLLGEGFNNRDIADQLLISERTVKQHISDMMSKSKVSNRVQLLNSVRDKGLA